MHAGDSSCCPADTSVCLCGTCSEPLPPGQVVACAQDSGVCCEQEVILGERDEKPSNLRNWMQYYTTNQ